MCPSDLLDGQAVVPEENGYPAASDDGEESAWAEGLRSGDDESVG